MRLSSKPGGDVGDQERADVHQNETDSLEIDINYISGNLGCKPDDNNIIRMWRRKHPIRDR